jgi:hypothetical protein
MTNSIRSPKKGITVKSQRIAEAVDNEDWQEFRVSLKGRTTPEKLYLLQNYYNEGLYHFIRGGICIAYPNCPLEVGAEEWSDYQIRIDNYIKALCRGGQLYAGESLKTALDNNWNLRIKK